MISKNEKKILGAFHIDDFIKFAEQMPEDILSEYRKKRTYINAVLATNEVSQYDKHFVNYFSNVFSAVGM